MSQSATGALTGTTYTVTITNGVPSSSSVTITAADTLEFENADSVSYLIKLYTSGNDKHLDLCPVIGNGTNNTLTFQPTPGLTNGNGKVYYTVLNLDGSPTTPDDTGGSNVIIIGSGQV